MSANNLWKFRKSYDKSRLDDQLPKEPLPLFLMWLDLAKNDKNIEEPNAMSLSTIGIDNHPKTRIVLLKQVDQSGFVFFSNYDSDKGKAIAQNSQVCLSFYWPSLERQVIVKGHASKTTAAFSDLYFGSRPKKSQLGALASPQSSILPNRAFLEKRMKQLEIAFKDTVVKRPKNWGGYLVFPNEIEFWVGRQNRLHDRIRYIRKGKKDWIMQRIAP